MMDEEDEEDFEGEEEVSIVVGKRIKLVSRGRL
jgi:hypothetical protein